jgi:hypothetical protein
MKYSTLCQKKMEIKKNTSCEQAWSLLNGDEPMGMNQWDEQSEVFKMAANSQYHQNPNESQS